ncbi:MULTISPECIES: hypothetical protein [unclassified Lysobacter]|jgi:hypothetical protein|uniref:hypothetical protein n=1 Tax=unclassified Lysobacter TaxID=2635362 RepID=UPI001F58E872|nr:MULTISPECIES: hypothetical protein [unclassified Lysobacter]HEX5663081.1 hypothetical protein [Xanthomonadaceae bacterium]
MNRNRLSLVLATALAGSIALVGCKKKEEPVITPPAAETPAPAPTEPAPAPAATTTVSSVDLGNAIGADNKIASPISTFATSDKIYASVASDGPNAGKLSAKWTHIDSNQTVHEESKDIPAGPQVTQFEISKPDGWPAGKYKLEVSLDGAVVQTREYEVK